MLSSNSRCRGVHRSTLVLATAFAMLAGHVHAATRVVPSGGVIQTALNAAAPGDTIVVSRGTYFEQLEINKDGIILIGGSGTTLRPPTVATTNACTGIADGALFPGTTQAGICIAGTGLTLVTGNIRHQSLTAVTTRVTGVQITGFTIIGFGADILVVGAKDTKVTGATLVDATSFGLLSVGSLNTNAQGNTATSTVEGTMAYGFQLSDVAPSTPPSQVASNKIDGYYCGVFIETNGVNVQANIVSNACVTFYVAPTIDGATIKSNKIGAPNANCTVGRGVWINGGVNTVVSSNTIRGQRLPSLLGEGVLIDAASVNNTIKSNAFSNNDDDLLITADATNVATANSCSVGQTCNS